MFYIYFLQQPQRYTVWKPVLQVECHTCLAPNDLQYRFCQMCGTLRRNEHHSGDCKPVIDTNPLESRWQELETTLASSKYNRKKSALEREFVSFLHRLSPPKSLDSVSPRDIIYFLIWKDKDSKTHVHRDTCRNQGTTSKTPLSCGCPRRLAFKTVDSCVGQLRAILRAHLETTTLPTTGDPVPNPAAHPAVKRYLKGVTEEQLKARAIPKQAEPIFICDLSALCQVMDSKLRSASTDPIHLYIYSRDLAYFKLHFFSGDRPSDLSHIKAAEILRFPNDKGLIFNHVFGKTLRSGDSKVFAVARHPNQFLCPVKALDDYMTICQAIRISVSTGPLFRATCGQSVLIDAFSTDAAEARLKTYLTAAGLSNKTLYSFRCGGAITMALTGSTLDDIVDHVGWRSHNMAKYYLQLHKSLQPASVAAKMALVTPETTAQYEELNQLNGFEPAFSQNTTVTLPSKRQSPRNC